MPCVAPELADRLADRKNMPLIEGTVERGAAMSGRAEGHPLPRHGRIRPPTVIGVDELSDVERPASRRRLARERADLRAHQEAVRSRR